MNKTVQVRRKPEDKHAHYTEQQKLEAVKLWMVVGSNVTVAAALGIQIDTFKRWKAQKWWKDAVEDLKHENSIRLSSRLRKIAEKSFELVEDRLENGDYIYDQKTGEMRRKPMLGKDVARIATDFVDKAIKIDSKPREEEQVVLGRLEDLAKRFEELAQKKQPIQVTDVITVKDFNG